MTDRLRDLSLSESALKKLANYSQPLGGEFNHATTRLKTTSPRTHRSTQELIRLSDSQLKAGFANPELVLRLIAEFDFRCLEWLLSTQLINEKQKDKAHQKLTEAERITKPWLFDR